MTRARTSRRLLALVVAALVLAPACSDDDGGDGDPTAGATDATTTTAAGEEPDEGSPAPSDLDVDAVRTAAAATRAIETGRFEFRAASDVGEDEPNVLIAEVSFAGDDSRARSSAEGPGSEPDAELGDLSDYEIVSVGGQTFLRGQIVDTIFGGGAGRWVRIPPSDDPATADALPIASPLDADSFLAVAEGAEGEVRSLGEDEIRGVACEHLRVTVPPEAFSAFDTSDLDVLAPGLFDDARPLDVWVCEDGYLHKVELELEADGRTTTLSAELYDLGEPIEITAPEDAIDIDPDSLFGGLFGEGG